ncbi:MAG: 50S ribosomal protein L21 [Planctomycetaceae bacterium]|nr:50S ribosomal protein L21 [Planctomycetota bacterium]NUP97225.1 50S ribosomal protein L21 [Planctomycetaceae bacterium]
MYAVISDRTRQFTVRTGDEILCDLGLEAAPGTQVTFDSVALVGHEGSVKIGKPFLAGAKVTGEVVGEELGDKVIAFRFKRRKNVRKKRGHRQAYVRVKISNIEG